MEQNFEPDHSNEVTPDSNSRNIFTRFFRKHRTDNETIQNITAKPKVEDLYSPDRKPDYWHPALLRMRPEEIREKLADMGIEQALERSQIIHYVGITDPAAVIDTRQTFSEYAQSNGLDESNKIVAVSLYTGDLTKSDLAILHKIKGYVPEGQPKPDVSALLQEMTPKGSEFVKNNVLANDRSLMDVWADLNDKSSEPISYFYNLKLSFVPKPDIQTHFWVGERYGGEIKRTFDQALDNGGGGGLIAYGVIEVSLASKPVGALYTNDQQTNTTQWTVDSFVRSHILNENDDHVIFTAG